MFSWDGPVPEPQVRTAEDLITVLADPTCGARGPLYYMYRDLAKSSDDRRWLSRQNLRYDITVIPPSVVCGEYVKTKGHYHPENRHGVRYPEIYEVLEGSAEYILQDIQLTDAVTVSAKCRDLVLIPPGYGHVTINPSDQTLVMANIVSDAFVSAYDSYEKFHGALYYRMAEGGYIKNANYPEVPPLRTLCRCSLGDFPHLDSMTLYDLIGDEEALRFLNQPEDYSFVNILKD